MHKKKKNNENEDATDKDSATHLLANSASFPNATLQLRIGKLL
jgi:hypothetical protein